MAPKAAPRRFFPLAFACLMVAGSAAVATAWLALREAELREDVLLSRVEGTTGAYKGFEAYLLREASLSAPKLANGKDREEIKRMLASLALDTKRVPASSEAFDALEEVRRDDGLTFLRRSYPLGTCQVLVLVPAYLVLHGKGSVDPLIRSEINETSSYDAKLCGLLTPVGTAKPQQAYYISAHGWLRLVRTQAAQGQRGGGEKMKEEFADNPNANFADRPIFRDRWKDQLKVSSSPPYIDTVGRGIVSTDAIAFQAGGGGAMVAVDVEIFQTREYLTSLKIGAVPGIDTLRASFVDCDETPRDYVCVNGQFATLGRMTRGGEDIFTVPVGPRVLAYYTLNPSHITWTRILFLLLLVLMIAAFAVFFLFSWRSSKQWMKDWRLLTEVQTNMPGGLAVIGADDQIVLTNESLKNLAGREELAGLSFGRDVLDSTSRSEFDERRRSESRFDMLVSLRRPAGELVAAIATMAPIEFNGESALMAVILPIERLLPVVAARFVNDFAHALKTPAHALVELSETLGEEGISPERTKRYAKLIAEEAARFREMVNSFLSFASLDLGVARAPILVDLPRAVRSIMKPFQERALQKGLKLRFSAPRRLRRLIDEVSFRLILTNLLENALKYTDRGEIEVTLIPDELGGRKCLALKVRDTGIGVPPDEREHVFERFTRGHGKAVRLQEGVGLGLFLVKRQVEILKGTLRLDSQVGKGTTFTILLPAAEEIVDSSAKEDADDD